MYSYLLKFCMQIIDPSILDSPKQPSVIDLAQTDEDVFLLDRVNKTLSPPQTPHIATAKKKFRTNPENQLYANFDAVVSHRAAQQFNDKSKPKVSKSTRKAKAQQHKQDQPWKSSEPSAKVSSSKKFLLNGNPKKSKPKSVMSGYRLTEVEGFNVTSSNFDRYLLCSIQCH